MPALPKTLLCALSLCVAGVAASAQVTGSAASEARQIAANPTYSAALEAQQSPEALLAEWDQKLAAAQSKTAPEFARFLLLPSAAKAALEAGANGKAKSYAEEALAFPNSHPEQVRPPFNHIGDVVFYCNLVLGRLALLDGAIPSAEKYLLLAGSTEGSPVLDSFGPNMSLARELLKRSRKEAVLQYLAECQCFWELENGRLAKWSDEIERDVMPVFGSSLFY